MSKIVDYFGHFGTMGGAFAPLTSTLATGRNSVALRSRTINGYATSYKYLSFRLKTPAKAPSAIHVSQMFYFATATASPRWFVLILSVLTMTNVHRAHLTIQLAELA